MPRRKSAPPETILEQEQADAGADSGIVGRVRAAFGKPDAPPREKKPPLRVPAGHPDETEVAELVALVNMPLAMVSPRDAFTPWETQRLASALLAYSEKDQRARRWMYGIVQKSALLVLLDTVVAIAIPRAIRHGWLVREIAPYVASICDPMQLADAIGMTPEEFARATAQPPPPPASPNGAVPPGQGEYNRDAAGVPA